LINDHDVQLKEFSQDILTRLAKVSAEVLTETAQNDELTGRIFKSFSEARTNGIRWGEIAEQAYMQARSAAEKA
jgi:TRAP-type mannitol/chloroaromatic compound transport system substrate-binding protein